MAKPYLGTTGAKRADLILKALGKDYRYQDIDGELCIYKRINANYDVEITGTNTRRYTLSMNLYLWKLEGDKAINTVAVISGIDTIEKLKDTMETLEQQARQGDLKPVSKV